MSLQFELKKSAVSQKQPFPSDLALGEIALNYHADGPFLTCKDTEGNIRKVTGVWVGASAPSSPTKGDPWLDTSSTPIFKVYDGSSWQTAATISVATTSAYGTVRLATSADITNGTSGKVVDAAQLASRVTTDISAALAADPFTIPNLSVTGNATVTGNLTVNGTETIINTTTLDVEDRNIVLGNVDIPTDTTANTGGITLKGATDKTFNWLDATDSWTSSENIDLASGKSYRIDDTEVLSGTTLGSGVVNSSLTSVGTIGTGTWQGTAIDDTYLDTISTAGKVSNSATTATDANTASAIVARDASGNFSAGSITADLTGNADTATALETARNIGGVSFDGTADIDLPGVNTTGNQDTAGNAATATKLSSSRTFALTGDVTGTVDSDLTSGASITAAIGSGVIVDADVNANAGIALSKLADVSATDKLLGRSSAGGGPIEEITCTSAGRALLDDADTAAQRATLGLELGVDVQPYDATILTDSDIGVTVQGYDATILTEADIGVTVQAQTSGVLTSSDIGVTVQAYDATLLNDADIGVTVQAYDATILKSSDIGETVQPYDATLLNAADIGETVQGFDATILKSADIGVTVQAYDADTAKLDTAQTFTATQTFDAGISLGGSFEQASEAVSALDVDCSAGNYFTKAISSNSTFTFSNIPTSGTAYSFTLEVDVTGTSTAITWPASVEWPYDQAPSLTDNKTHLFMFVTNDGGTTWRGAALVDYTT